MRTPQGLVRLAMALALALMATGFALGTTTIQAATGTQTAYAAQAGKWKQSNGKWWYAHDGGGYAQSGWEKIGGVWYLFDNGGWMLTGWQKVGGTWYYLSGSGAMQTNRWIGNYYVGSSGAMATNAWIGNYYVGPDGRWVPGFSNSDQQKPSIPDNNSGTDQPSRPAPTPSQQLVQRVGSYTYKVRPIINGTLNTVVFVETNNPDPDSFCLVDESSKYASTGQVVRFDSLETIYADVQYTNKSTRRIANKGYLFEKGKYESDGGALKVIALTDEIYTEGYGAGDTGITIDVGPLMDAEDYLISTYTNDNDTFFGKLDAVQSILNDLAIYPKTLLNTSQPNANAYPGLLVARYPELELKSYIEGMYEHGSLFLNRAYGLTLDSLGMPGMMEAVAKRINPSCVIKSGSTHDKVTISFNGTTKTYGGQGNGGPGVLYSDLIPWRFKFDGTDVGFGTNLSMSILRQAWASCTESSAARAETYLHQVDGESMTATVGEGGWLRLGIGPRPAERALGYATMGPTGTVAIVSEGWVDGRYIDAFEKYRAGATFTEFPKANIVVPNVTYKRKSGDITTGNVTYQYFAESDVWCALDFYEARERSVFLWFKQEVEALKTASPNLVLTRSQVEQMVAEGSIDGKTNVTPSCGYIYDGSVAPGTYSDHLTDGCTMYL